MNLLRWALLGVQAVGELLTNLLNTFAPGDLVVFDPIDLYFSFVQAIAGDVAGLS